MRLHLGCGRIFKKGWENIDLYSDMPGVIKMDIKKLEYPDKCADEILAQMVIEHVPRMECVPTLKEWCRVLKPDGLITIATSDLDGMVRDWLDKGHQVEVNGQIKDYIYNLRGIFGQQNEPGQFHYNGFDFNYLKICLEKAGFDRVTLMPPDHPHHLWATARRPSDS